MLLDRQTIVDEIKEHASNTSETPATLSRLIFHEENHILSVALHNEFRICKLKETNGTIGEAIGCFASNEPTNYQNISNQNIKPIHVNAHVCRFTDDLLNKGPQNKALTLISNNPNFKTERKHQAQHARNDFELSVINILCDKQLTPTEKEFDKILQDYLKHCTPNLLLNSKQHKNSSFYSKKLKKQFTIQVSPVFIQKVISRCIEDKMWNSIKKFIRFGLLRFSFEYDRWIDIFMENNQIVCFFFLFFLFANVFINPVFCCVFLGITSFVFT